MTAAQVIPPLKVYDDKYQLALANELVASDVPQHGYIQATIADWLQYRQLIFLALQGGWDTGAAPAARPLPEKLEAGPGPRRPYRREMPR